MDHFAKADVDLEDEKRNSLHYATVAKYEIRNLEKNNGGPNLTSESLGEEKSYR